MARISNVVFKTHLYTAQYIDAVRRDGAKAEAVLTQPFVVEFMWGDELWELKMTKGFAAAPSIPKVFRSFISVAGAIWWASFPHDWIWEFRSMPLKDSDNLMIACMKALEPEREVRPGAVGIWDRIRNRMAAEARRLQRGAAFLAVRLAAQFRPDAVPTYKGLTRLDHPKSKAA